MRGLVETPSGVSDRFFLRLSPAEGDAGPRLGRDPMIRCSVTFGDAEAGMVNLRFDLLFGLLILTKVQMRFPVELNESFVELPLGSSTNFSASSDGSSYQSDWVSQRVVQWVAFG